MASPPTRSTPCGTCTTGSPDAELYFITGADALASILSWQEWQGLFDRARFVGVSRPGYDLHIEHLAGHLEGLPADAVSLVEIPALAISSTDCRTRVSANRPPVWYLVPDGVVQYISKRNLYRPQDSRRPDGAAAVTDPQTVRSGTSAIERKSTQ